ncbi:MAG: hypothetical protein WC760_07695 [Bacteroidia bacterium]
MNQIKENVLKVLQYYNYFSYPLTLDELYYNFPVSEKKEDIALAVNALVDEAAAFRFDELFSLVNQQERIERRKLGNALAVEKIRTAQKVGRFISLFPFVSTVFISGSLSKNYADENTDMDFFICTEPQRLWIARSLLHAFKKLTFLVGKQHNFCMNYFVDMDHLKLEEQNIYTAIELSTLKPVKHNDDVYREILRQNEWIRTYLPNVAAFNDLHGVSEQIVKRKRKTGGVWFDALNRWLMQATSWYWKRKWTRRKFPEDQYDLAFKSRIYVSKNHPQNYQKRVLEYCKMIGLSE